MSSDPKKPPFDAPPAGTPDLLQKDVSLDRRRRVPTFEELQAQQHADVATDPLRPAMARPNAIPQATVPARPATDDLPTQSMHRIAVPPGMQPRQPVMNIRTPTPPTQPARPLQPAPPPAPRAPPAAPPRAAIPPPPPARIPTPPTQPPARPAAPRTAPPTAAEMWSTQPQQARAAAAPPPNQAIPTQPARQPVPPPPRAANEATGMLPPLRAAPPSPGEFAQTRPQPAAMPQVTPSVPSQGAVMPEGQSATPTHRASQAALKPAPPPPPPRAVIDEPEPLTLPSATPVPRTFTPSPMQPPRKPNVLPAEMLVTQPGLPGPFAQARAMPQGQAIPQRPPSMPELPKIEEPALSSGVAPVMAAPQFGTAQFEEPLLPTTDSDTVTAEPAALWRRMGAWLTDLLFVGVLVLIFLMVAMAVIAPKNLTPLQQLITIAVPAAALAGILAFVYTTLFAFLWNGRTPGRRLMGICLVDSTGHAPGPARALVRAMLSLVSFGLFLSGFWLALFDRHGQTLHDKLTRTFVVKLQDA